MHEITFWTGTLVPMIWLIMSCSPKIGQSLRRWFCCGTIGGGLTGHNNVWAVQNAFCAQTQPSSKSARHKNGPGWGTSGLTPIKTEFSWLFLTECLPSVSKLGCVMFFGVILIWAAPPTTKSPNPGNMGFVSCRMDIGHRFGWMRSINFLRQKRCRDLLRQPRSLADGKVRSPSY